MDHCFHTATHLVGPLESWERVFKGRDIPKEGIDLEVTNGETHQRGTTSSQGHTANNQQDQVQSINLIQDTQCFYLLCPNSRQTQSGAQRWGNHSPTPQLCTHKLNTSGVLNQRLVLLGLGHAYLMWDTRLATREGADKSAMSPEVSSRPSRVTTKKAIIWGGQAQMF